MDQVTFTDKDLYATSNAATQPKIDDVRQGSLGNCWFASTLGAMAQQQPERIVDAIAYDEATQTFSVRFFAEDEKGKMGPVMMDVSQRELTDHLATFSAGLENSDGSKRPIWQSVMEAGFAKYLDTDHSDGLDEGYRRLDSAGLGADALAALTGEVKAELGDIDVAEIGAKGLHDQLRVAMEEGRPVTIGTKAEVGAAQDGLMDRHSYTVVGVGRDASGEPTVDLRNPFGRNWAGEHRDSDQAVIQVRVADLVAAGSIIEVAVGPEAARLRRQETSTEAPQSALKTGDSEVDSLLRNAHDPVALRRTMGEMLDGLSGDVFREVGRAQSQALIASRGNEVEAQAPIATQDDASLSSSTRRSASM